MHTVRPTKRAIQGFTLIELLTVIAIIGILAAIIIPVVSKVRSSARQIESMSNVRQIAMAMILYANDNKDHLPYGKWQGVYQLLHPDQMKSYIAQDDPVWWCPILTKFYKLNIHDSNDNARYWKARIRTNPWITGEKTAAQYATCGRAHPETSHGMLLGSFVRPSQSMLTANLDASDRGGYNDGYANVGFADGSARKMKDDTFRTGNAPAGPGVYWRYYVADSEGKRYGYDY